MLGGGGYHPPAAPDNVFCRGAQCAPAIPRLSTTPPTCNVGATPRPRAQPKGPRGVLRRAAARAAPTGGCREEEPSPAGRSGTGPYSGRNAAHRADTFRTRYRVSVFHGADMHRSPRRIPAFRRGGYYPPAVLEPRFGWGGYHPPAALDDVFHRGAQCAPAVPRLSTSPSMWKRWVTPRPGGTSQEAEGCAEAGGREGRPYGGLP